MVKEVLDADYGESEETQPTEFEEVDYNEIEDKLNMTFEEAGLTKPTFEHNTNAQIDKLELTRAVAPKTDKNGKEYYEYILQITCSIDDSPLETVDNYGGLREYSTGFWNGNKSAFGRLKQLAEDEFGIKSFKDMLTVLKGKKVKIKTETNSFNGKQFKKNMIQLFR